MFMTRVIYVPILEFSLEAISFFGFYANLCSLKIGQTQ